MRHWLDVLIQQVTNTPASGTGSSTDGNVTLPVTLAAVIVALGLSPYLGRFWGAIIKSLESLSNVIDNREKERVLKIAISENQLKQTEQLFEELTRRDEQKKRDDIAHEDEVSRIEVARKADNDRHEKFFSELTAMNLGLTKTNLDLTNTNLQMQQELTAERTLANRERAEHKEETRLMVEEKQNNLSRIAQLEEDLRIMTEKYNRMLQENETLKKQLQTGEHTVVDVTQSLAKKEFDDA